MLNIFPYTKFDFSSKGQENGVNEQIILRLIENFIDKGHTFYMDGMYTSISLLTKI